ncbi:hypothetical protein BDV93DRAFT_605633 [Ceratobasidium sp. AG-I]|nr:hypothetical protein BDV93DRAFT_605633 [Ceratobasidium sp. AG-I]
MNVWPTHSHSGGTTERSTRRGARKIKPEPNWDVSVLDSGTRVSSRLVVGKISGSSRLSWSNINETDKHVSTGNTRCIFPPTRELSPALHNGLSFEQKVLHTNSWLRTHPEVLDIDALFLRELLEGDTDYSKKILDHDPYISDLMSLSFVAKGHKKRSGVLAYPMGQHFEKLGAAVVFDEKWGTVVVPVEEPVWKAASPIVQIVSSNMIYKPSAVDYTKAGCLFAVRTLFDVNFVCIAPKPGVTVPAKAHLISSFSSAEIGGHRPFDLAFSPYPGHEGLVVSDVGTVWGFKLGIPLQKLNSSTDDDSSRVGAHDWPYWSVNWGTHPETFFLGSQSSFSLYDRRSSSVASALAINDGTLTSFDVLRNKDFAQIFLSDTEHVSLLDERMIARPLVSWKHRRAYDRTLRIKALTIENKQLGLLSSKKSNFVAVYDPLLSKHGALTGGDSYTIDSGIGNRCQSISMVSYNPPIPPKSTTPPQSTLFYLSHTGALHRQDLAVGPVKPSGERELWAYELKQRAASVVLERETHGDLDLTKSKQIKMRKGYERLYRSESFLGFNTGGPSVIDVVDLAPTAFQRASEPIEKPMTLHDMIRSVSQETIAAAPRSLFASASSLPLPNATALLKYVIQLRSQTRETTPWSYDLTTIQGHIWPALAHIPNANDLAVFSTSAAEDDTSGKASAKDTKHRDEIALDLALAMTTYSAVPFQPSRPRPRPAPIAKDDDDMLSVAATALTLEDAEPPHIQHIQPCPTLGLVDGRMGAEQRQSLVVRLLASEWDPDSEVGDYEFFDPYGQDYDESMPAWRLSAQTRVDKMSRREAKSKFSLAPNALGSRPTNQPIQLPFVQISRTKSLGAPKSSVAQAQGVSSRLVESQPEVFAGQTMSSQPRGANSSQMTSSQLPSTQVLPGPFGGRPGGGTVRKKKSRLPGF